MDVKRRLEFNSLFYKSGAVGCGALIAIALILLILFLIGSNAALGYYFKHCQEEDFFDCLLNKIEEEPKPEGTVAATGTYSYKDYSSTVIANIPLEGGEVTGTISGTCEGKLKGNYDGQSNGVISGKMAGACSPFFVNIPASAEFSGTVNKDRKIVPIQVKGRGAGITRDGSMTLTY